MSVASGSGAATLPGNLASLVERLWVDERDADWPVIVSTGPLPSSHVAVETYVVWPSLRRPRFLLPVGAPAAVAAAFTRFLTTPSTRARVVGMGLAAGCRAGLTERLFTDRLVVGIDRRVQARDRAEWLLAQRLAEDLDTPDLVAVHPVRRAVPAAKPTLRLFDRRGLPKGYAKVGWSAPTRAMVRAETSALHDLDGGVGIVRAPRALAAGEWQDHSYLVAAPLPPGLQRWHRPPEQMPEAMRRIAATGDAASGTLADSPYLRKVRDRIQASANAEPEAAAALSAWLERLHAHHARLEYGRWHGDWVSWNLGGTDGEAYSWDWEYSDRCVPVGFDLLHWHFQHRLAETDGTVVNATQTLDEVTSRLSVLRVPAENQRLVASLYLLEMLTRALVLAAHGHGWNPKLYPAMLAVVGDRAQSG
jgi:hypothetical protein